MQTVVSEHKSIYRHGFNSSELKTEHKSAPPSFLHIHSQEFYDLDFKLFRIDYYVEAQSGLPAGAYSFIHDFNLKTQYIINRQYGNCSIKPIEPQAGFDTVVKDGIARSASPSEVLLLSNQFSYAYEGVSTVRGVEVDSWISYSEFQELGQVNLSNVLYELFFTRPDWSIGSVSSRASSDTTTPWRFHLTGTVTYQNSSTNLPETRNASATYDFFSFSDGEPDLDVFDTSVCVAPSDYYIVVLSLPVENVLVDFSRLRRTVRDRVSDVTGVRPLQIGNIQVKCFVRFIMHISTYSNIQAVIIIIQCHYRHKCYYNCFFTSTNGLEMQSCCL